MNYDEIKKIDTGFSLGDINKALKKGLELQNKDLQKKNDELKKQTEEIQKKNQEWQDKWKAEKEAEKRKQTELDEKIKQCTDEITINPKDPANYLKRGFYYDEKGIKYYKQAQADYDKAIELDPNNYNAYKLRGIHYLHLPGGTSNSIEDFTKAISLNPNDDECYDYLGVAHREYKHYDKAIENHTKAISINPNKDVYYYNRANAYLGLDKYEETIKDFDEAIMLSPEPNKSYYNSLGIAYYRLKNYQEAIKKIAFAIIIECVEDQDKFYNRISDEYYGDVGTYFGNLGTCYLKLNKYEEALKYFKKVGYDEKRNNFYRDVLLSYQEEIKNNPSNGDYYSKCGDIYFDLKEYDNAINSFSNAINLNSNNADYYNGRGRAYCELSKYEDAMADFNKALQIDKKNAAAHNGKGVVYQKLNEHKKAVKEFSSAIKIDPDEPLYYKNRKESYFKLNNFKWTDDDSKSSSLEKEKKYNETQKMFESFGQIINQNESN